MPHHDGVLFLEGPASSEIVRNHTPHVLDDVFVDLFNFVLPRHRLVDGGAGERMRKSIEPVIVHRIIVEKLYQITLLQLSQ